VGVDLPDDAADESLGKILWPWAPEAKNAWGGGNWVLRRKVMAEGWPGDAGAVFFPAAATVWPSCMTPASPTPM